MPCDNPNQAHNHVPWPQVDAELTIHKCERTCQYCPARSASAANLRGHVYSVHLQPTSGGVAVKPGVWITGYDGSVVERSRRYLRELRKRPRSVNEKDEQTARGKSRKRPARRGYTMPDQELAPGPAVSATHSMLSFHSAASVGSAHEEEQTNTPVGESNKKRGSAAGSTVGPTITQPNSNKNSISTSTTDIVDLTGEDEVESAEADDFSSFGSSVPHGLPMIFQDAARDEYRSSFNIGSIETSTRGAETLDTQVKMEAPAVDTLPRTEVASAVQQVIQAGHRTEPIHRSNHRDLEMLSHAAFEREGRLIDLSLERARLEERKLRYEEERERRAAMRS